MSLDDIRAAIAWIEGQKEHCPQPILATILLVLGAALKIETGVRSATAALSKIMASGKINPPSEKGTGRKRRPSDDCDRLITKARRAIRMSLSIFGKHKAGFKSDPKERKSTGPLAPVGAMTTPVTPTQATEGDVENMSGAVPPELKNVPGMTGLEAISDMKDDEAAEEAIGELMNKQLELGRDSGEEVPHAREELFGAGSAASTNQSMSFEFDPEVLATLSKGTSNVSRVSSYQSNRFDFTFSTGTWKVTTDVLRDPATGTTISAQPDTLALRGYQVTLRSMVNLVVLTVGFLMPMHRIGRLLGNMPIFHRANIGRFLGVVAERAVPVYLEMLRQLANASHLAGDASPTRVNEVDRLFESRRMAALDGKVPEPFPWETPEVKDLADPDQETVSGSETPSPSEGDPPTEGDPLTEEAPTTRISPVLFQKLGYDFRKRKDVAARTPRHQTIVLHGFTDDADADSHTVVFRSCLGDVGNVLDKILLDRLQNKPLTLQCDHSVANLPQDPAVLKRVQITVAGCLAHLRRPFKRHFDQDPERCEEILTLMVSIFFSESELKRVGRNPKNTLAVRQTWSASSLDGLHDIITEFCQLPTWSDQTPLGKAGRSFLRHFKKLLPFLSDPMLEATNNGSERLLRPEKLAQGSSYFRDTIEGRARFDILRSLCQTCAGIELSFASYLMHLLLADPKQVNESPKRYTPLSVKQHFIKNPEDLKRIQIALLRGY